MHPCMKYFLLLKVFGDFAVFVIYSKLSVRKVNVDSKLRLLSNSMTKTRNSDISGFVKETIVLIGEQFCFRVKVEQNGVRHPLDGELETKQVPTRVTFLTGTYGLLGNSAGSSFNHSMSVVVLKEWVETCGMSSSVGQHPLVRLCLITQMAHMKYCSFS